ncbi:hypothetical protein [Pseudofrankia inefficax]|uniref:LPXTG-motif cell wall anchor domain protein n=1 Tax=Pseudofrankia inefficax (strain DSM 45817 / CECT 9037 / DDB 130130 / EuI1c) TaxID=298654 RepID=E3IX08_PSEI1|nr:hypothetical protein [Pseudofrankia inefficax]ADP83780.1 hypothetical protein FraEuI1c_5796 [Pseudofrankia inefficax]
MKLRALGVALLASCGLALAVLPASVAAAVDDPTSVTSPVTSDFSPPPVTGPDDPATGIDPAAVTGPDPVTGADPAAVTGPDDPGINPPPAPDDPNSSILDDKKHPVPGPYPPSKKCGGLTGNLSVDRSVVVVGGSVVFSACGFIPGAIVTIAVNGTTTGTVTADSNGDIVGQAVFTEVGKATLTATGEGSQKIGILGDIDNGPGINVGLAAPMDMGMGTQSITRIVSAKIDVLDPNGKDINGTFIPIPIPIPIFIGGNDDKNNCIDGNKDGKDGVNTLSAVDDKNNLGKDGRNGLNCVGAVGVGVVGVGVGAGGVGGAGATPAGGALPFTGVETGAMASIAFALLGGGLLLRVAARRRRNTLGAHTEG